MNTHTLKSTLLTTLSATALALSLGGSAHAEDNPTSTASPEAQAARADVQKTLGFTPGFIKALPDDMVPGAWAELKSLQAAPNTALPCFVKEIIGVAVSAQLPSAPLVYGYSQVAKAAGATQAQIGDAVAVAALTRHWSTFMNGIQLDETKFRAELGKFLGDAKKAMASGTPPPAPTPIKVVDAKSATADIRQNMMGTVPEFLAKFPAPGLAGAWLEERDVELSETTALPGKYKSLVGLAVAAQIPCRYCIIADTEFAKLGGATDAEIAEAVAMGGVARHWATVFTGFALDEPTFKKDMERIAKLVAAANKTASGRKPTAKTTAMATSK
jgi:AhpD family alkylhydroperoxidase